MGHMKELHRALYNGGESPEAEPALANCLSGEDSERPMHASGTTYSGTISVSPYIKIWNRERYRDFTNECQREIIEYELKSHIGCDNLESKGVFHYFELTQKKNIHCHLLFKGWTEESMKCLQTKMAIKFGYAKDPIDRAFYYEKTRVDVKFWEKYMLKDQ